MTMISFTNSGPIVFDSYYLSLNDRNNFLKEKRSTIDIKICHFGISA